MSSGGPGPDLVARIGSVLLAAPKSIEASRLAEGLQVSPEDVIEALRALDTMCRQIGGEVVAGPSGYRLVARSENGAVVRGVLAVPKRRRLTRESIETLIIIMKERAENGKELVRRFGRNAVSSSYIGEIRRVKNLRGTIETLLDEGVIQYVGRGRCRGAPRLYVETQAAHDRFGLELLEEGVK